MNFPTLPVAQEMKINKYSNLVERWETIYFPLYLLRGDWAKSEIQGGIFKRKASSNIVFKTEQELHNWLIEILEELISF